MATEEKKCKEAIDGTTQKQGQTKTVSGIVHGSHKLQSGDE